VRVDSGVEAGSEVSPLYDPMIAKLIVLGADRDDAIGRMLRALSEYRIDGIETLLGFHQALLTQPCFRAGETCDGIVESEELAERAKQFSHRTTSLPSAADGAWSELATEAVGSPVSIGQAICAIASDGAGPGAGPG